jgi:hypothetical protein
MRLRDHEEFQGLVALVEDLMWYSGGNLYPFPAVQFMA